MINFICCGGMLAVCILVYWPVFPLWMAFLAFAIIGIVAAIQIKKIRNRRECGEHDHRYVKEQPQGETLFLDSSFLIISFSSCSVCSSSF